LLEISDIGIASATAPPHCGFSHVALSTKVRTMTLVYMHLD
jgi:hypothetical protein